MVTYVTHVLAVIDLRKGFMKNCPRTFFVKIWNKFYMLTKDESGLTLVKILKCLLLNKVTFKAFIDFLIWFICTYILLYYLRKCYTVVIFIVNWSINMDYFDSYVLQKFIVLLSKFNHESCLFYINKYVSRQEIGSV